MNARGRRAAAILIAAGCLLSRTAYAQTAPEAPQPSANQQGQTPAGEQPSPFTAPNPPMPDAAHAPGQQAVPGQLQPQATPDAPLPQPDQSTTDLRDLPALSAQPAGLATTSPAIQQVENDAVKPKAEAPSGFNTHWYSVVGPYRAPSVPELPRDSPMRVDALIKDGKLYLSLHDAIALALENNLDVEVSRYNLLLADTDLLRAQGGGSLRGPDYTIEQTAPGVGSLTSPLLVTATTTGTAAPTSVNVTDLSQVTQIGDSVQQSLTENGTSAYSAGPSVPFFDPVLTAEAGYFRRSDQNELVSTSATGTGSSTTAGANDFVNAEVDYQEGFSTGAQLDAFVNNSAQALYAGNSQLDPFHVPSASLTLTQPLLRGRGREVNLRFLRIARLDQKVSRLVFEQQLLETVYGVSRLYFDLVSLGENIEVKQESLAAAQKLYDDDRNQVDQGTLAPIELTRAQALLSSSRLDLIQAQGEYRQQEVVLREQLTRVLGENGAALSSIVPTDKITVPDDAPVMDVPAMIEDALSKRPDLAQAGMQVKADEISAKAARNNVKPMLNVYANAQTRGSGLTPYSALGSAGTGVDTVPPALFQGGLRLSTIYQGGLQLNIPLRNRIAQADSARDTIQLRQAEGRTAKLENDIRQQIESSAIALETAHQAYAAAVESRDYQQQLLQAEIDKFTVGESTNFLIVQDEAYLAQARSTEVAARSDWMKAKLALDRSLGDLLEKNNIMFDDVVAEKAR